MTKYTISDIKSAFRKWQGHRGLNRWRYFRQYLSESYERRTAPKRIPTETAPVEFFEIDVGRTLSILGESPLPLTTAEITEALGFPVERRRSVGRQLRMLADRSAIRQYDRNSKRARWVKVG